MASRISQLSALTGAGTASNDLLPIVDVSDTSMAASGTDKKITLTELQSAPVSAGTANGVMYLNGSKVATSGSALTFDGTNLGVSGTGNRGLRVTTNTSGNPTISLTAAGVNAGYLQYNRSSQAIQLSADGVNNFYSADYIGAHQWFKAGGTETMRLDSSGNLGIGTSYPNAKLEVSGNAMLSVGRAYGQSADVSFSIGGTDNGYVNNGATSHWRQYVAGNEYGQALRFEGFVRTSGWTERMCLDSSGNLGLGVTPSAWGGYRALQVNNASMSSAAATSIVLSANTYNASSTGWKYISTAAATQYEQFNGGHYWSNAPSGTAGDPISFTQAMTLDANGNLLVGTTNANANLQKGLQIASTNWGSAVSVTAGALSGTCAAWGRSSDGNVAQFYRDTSFTTLVGSISVTASATAYNTSSDYRLKDNQKPLTGSGEFIDALKPKTWDWKADGSRGVGFIAHEVQEVSPTSVVGEKDATRIEQYEISPAVPAVLDEEGNVVTPAVEAVMGEREVPAYQAMEYGSAEFIANIVAELQSLRKRVAALEAGGI